MSIVLPETQTFPAALADAIAPLTDPHSLARARHALHRKGAIIAVWYLASFVALLLADGWLQGILACASFALALAAVGFNIQHDANHGAFFDQHGSRRLTRANRIAGWSLYCLGADSARWIYRHGTLHHSAPNVTGVDTDIDVGSLARLSPNQPWRPWHRFQHLYLWVLYCFTAIELMFFDLAFLVSEARHPTRTRPRPSAGQWALALGTKLAAAGVLIGVPLLFHPAWIVALGTAGVLLGAGLLLGVVFQCAHVVSEAQFATTETRAEQRWHEWQIRSSVDFADRSSRLGRALTWYAGGLDYQREHHLFPHLPHTLYPTLAPTVSEVCRRYGLPDYALGSFGQAVRSHARLITALAKRP